MITWEQTLKDLEKFEREFGRYRCGYYEPPTGEVTLSIQDYERLEKCSELWNDVQSGKVFASKWNPCNGKMLPKEGELVLCTEKDTKKLYIGWFEIIPDVGGRWFDYLGFSMDVEAWMPLPKAYEGDE